MKKKRAKRPTVQERRRAANHEFMKAYYALPKEAFFPKDEKYKCVRISEAQLKIHKSLVRLLTTERGARFQIGDFPDK
jgi:hypothetical protein